MNNSADVLNKLVKNFDVSEIFNGWNAEGYMSIYKEVNVLKKVVTWILSETDLDFLEWYNMFKDQDDPDNIMEYLEKSEVGRHIAKIDAEKTKGGE